MKPVLAVPACEPGRGGGHLIRCVALVRGLRELGREAWLYLPAAANESAQINTILGSTGFDRNWLIAEAALQDKSWNCIILDRFQTSRKELSRWSNLAPVIGIDEGGPCRAYVDFLIDILPGCNRITPNIADPSLLPLPLFSNCSHGGIEPTVREAQRMPLKILVSFGQEDAVGLGLAVGRAFASTKANAEIILLRGGLGNKASEIQFPGFTEITAIPNLANHLTEYDLIITHYGLTAFEALYAGVPVLLLSPGAYHEKLAKTAGFFSLGIGKGRAKKLPRLLFNKSEINEKFLRKLKDRCTALALKHNLAHAPRQSLAELINSFTPDLSRFCPACGGELRGAVLARSTERTYRRCEYCGVIAMDRLNPPPIEYGREYFFELYQKQYGKTYIEDFPNLIAMGKRRLSVIKSLLAGDTAPLLLDIGCAYGAFLVAAKEAGFSPCGIDPAEDAVRYVTQTLGITAEQGFFPSDPLPPYHSCHAVTLWYVIEHFRNCVPALEEIRTLLKPGGVLAFATPSYSGISGRSSLRRFLERSPADHWTIWSPAACKKALHLAGFSVKKMVNTGHHPERFPLLGKFAANKKSALYRALLVASKLFALGDTFEVYVSPIPHTEHTKVHRTCGSQLTEKD